MYFCTIAYPTHGAPNNYIKNSLDRLSVSCRNKNCIEIIVKLDDYEDVSYYNDLLMNSGFPYKILCYAQQQDLADAHYFHYDMFQISSGEMYWTLSDEILISCDDFCSEISKIIDLFDDGLYIHYVKSVKKK